MLDICSYYWFSNGLENVQNKTIERIQKIAVILISTCLKVIGPGKRNIDNEVVHYLAKIIIGKLAIKT